VSTHFEDAHLLVHVGDARDCLRELPDASVHCVVTSPPYWGLRDYGTATWDGGDPDCKHSVGGQVQDSKWEGAITTGQRPGVDASRCRKCGAVRNDRQLGLEPTPEEYVANMVAVFREVRRVLRDDGTLWLNLGDSYAGSWGNQGRREGRGNQRPINGPMLQNVGSAIHAIECDMGVDCSCGARVVGVYPNVTHTGSWVKDHDTLKPKDLVGIPWRVAFALQADGWYLRSDIIWSKLNPMPESVTDRPTKSHEYVFLLSKSARYFFDAYAVREAVTGGAHPQGQGVGRKLAAPGSGIKYNGSMAKAIHNATADDLPTSRNLRTVWTIATEPYPGAHFATFPRKLVEPCVKAGTSERGVCPKCGAPWVRDLQPSCAHVSLRPVPATVLDPFAGSGTTGLVANALGRRAVLIDLSADYIDQAMQRNAQAPLGIAT
jgi:DNA modification methylase